jgi:hypothetical protein
MSQPAGGVSQVQEGSSTADVVKDVVIIFMVGVAIVIGLLIVTYLLMLILDKYCCCIPGWSAAGESTEIDHGSIARKAGLWGLRACERRQIFEHILVGKPYEKSDEENPNLQRNACEMKDDEPGKTGTVDDEEAKANAANETIDNDEEEGEAKVEEQEGTDVNGLDEVNHDVLCAICLCEYEDGEMVLTGTSCNHLFHKSCAFEWLSNHDHCPYCRKEMITAAEMASAAEELLGQDRVLEMRVWGPTQELSQNNFASNDGEIRHNVNISNGSVELSPSPPVRHHHNLAGLVYGRSPSLMHVQD